MAISTGLGTDLGLGLQVLGAAIPELGEVEAGIGRSGVAVAVLSTPSEVGSLSTPPFLPSTRGVFWDESFTRRLSK
jgi:hypothetical protein